MSAKPSTTDSATAHRTDTVMLCGQYDVYNSSTGDLTFNSDAWNPTKAGAQCVTVNKNATTFEATWNWQSDGGIVHSYPHVKFNAPSLPVPFSNISSIDISSQWAMNPSFAPGFGIDAAGLGQINTVANVALDMFADADPAHAQSEIDADFEIMIWLGSFGDPKPLGFSGGSACWNQSLGDVIFQLYTGKNTRGHRVFSWISPINMTDFNEDISPLLQALWRNDFIPKDTLLGLVEFGSEAFYSDQNVTFTVSKFGLNLTSGPCPSLNVTQAPKSCSKSSASTFRMSAAIAISFLGIFVVALFL